MQDSCKAEIERLHEFFVEWFTAATAQDDFERCHSVLSENFTMVNPSGELLTHSQLVSHLEQAYGCYKGEQFSIEIRNFQILVEEESLCLVAYEEWQLLDAVTTSRRSTALFRPKEETPFGVEWVQLHETWMDNGSDHEQRKAKVAKVSSSTESHHKRTPSLVSKRHHMSPQLPQYQATVMEHEGEVVGIHLNGWSISSQQGSIGDDAWFSQAAERLQEQAQPPVAKEEVASHTATYRHVCLPEMVFPQAHITIEQQVGGIKLRFRAYRALLEWAQAHQHIALQSKEEYRGVSVLQTKDAKLWSAKTAAPAAASNFHYDWTFSTPYASTTTMDVSWKPLPESGMNLDLLKDQSLPILLFDEVVLYEDDLHDNGIVKLSCKIRVMPTCAFMLERLWVRVDGVLLRVRDTRVSLEFPDKIYRDVVWRQCAWEDLPKYNLPTDLRVWCPETGGVSENEWQAMLLRLPEVELPEDLPAYAVLDESGS